MAKRLTRKEKKQVEQLMTDMLFELWEEQFLTNDTSITYANAWDYLPGYQLPQNFQCAGIDNAGKFLFVGQDGYVRLTAVEPGTGVPQEYVDQQDQAVLETATERLEEGSRQLTQLINQEAETRAERDDALLNNINHLGDRVTDIERQEDTWNAKTTVSVSPTGTATNEVSYITIDDNEYKLAGGGSGGTTVIPSLQPVAGAKTIGSLNINGEDWNTPSGGTEQQQADWTQTDTTAVDFIKNKPDLSTKQDKLTAGQNITIANNVISATGELSSVWGQITGTLSNQTDLMNKFNEYAKLNVENEFTQNNIFNKNIFVTGGVNTYGTIFTHKAIQINGDEGTDDYTQFLTLQWKWPSSTSYAFDHIFTSKDNIKIHNVGTTDVTILPKKNGTVAFTSDIPSINTILNQVYPIGSIYISMGSTLPSNFPGTWEKISDGFFLEATTTTTAVEKQAGLPNIKGVVESVMTDQGSSETQATGAFTFGEAPRVRHYEGASGNGLKIVNFNANTYNSIYNDETTTVQPKSLTVTMWKRTA